ncbi:TetR/AcrR family transcriptional regulator [Sphingobium sp. LB126]|uniref:TetR/AcrR family transcriptional regulator n=1 Tax=Sphingobium sp. LB126 TaxID=1983755 RepID=UPI0012FD0F3C|nr:TetR/AcrR family transcriptional regulator [Sphingobium sp. LB126]
MTADDHAMDRPVEPLQLEVSDARSRILDAAAHLFRREGFSGTSMDAIAALARMSKRTLYASFPDKRAVLEAVLQQFIARRFFLIERVSRDAVSDEALLTRMVGALHAMATDEDALAMYRLLVAQATNLPALASDANRNGLMQVQAMLRQPLRNCGVRDPDMAARLLYDLAVLAPMHRLLVGMEDMPMDTVAIVHMVLQGMKGM